MLLPAIAVLIGLVVLIWSADRFVEGAADTAAILGVPPLLIGMVIIGFGTSAPELVVSALASSEGNPGIALGNAYGSNISNIALILGTTAVIAPIVVQSQIVRRELPVLIGATLIAVWQLADGAITRLEGIILLVVFAGIMGLAIWHGLRQPDDVLAQEVTAEMSTHQNKLGPALFWLLLGLLLLIASSRALVWGSVEIAQGLGVSDLIIGLTIVAIGTSLPELASSIAACRKGENDIALGNVIGSNLFNTLAVVGIAGTIHPMTVEPEVLTRDAAVMGALTLLILGLSYRREGHGQIGRLAGVFLLACFLGYNAYLVSTVLL
ncbi:sodium:calcium antiporter [Haliea atlantica]|jgi:cation:H+ antiporter|nr:calcium/sodium antiporter [Haliea sp.]MAL93779.1 calcium/sodium antiporter [Haliea sp.]|tara:strand:- start:1743 stop:2711 length:969 start_codon:yes stop_codon:yes gene_type:complete